MRLAAIINARRTWILRIQSYGDDAKHGPNRGSADCGASPCITGKGGWIVLHLCRDTGVRFRIQSAHYAVASENAARVDRGPGNRPCNVIHGSRCARFVRRRRLSSGRGGGRGVYSRLRRLPRAGRTRGWRRGRMFAGCGTGGVTGAVSFPAQRRRNGADRPISPRRAVSLSRHPAP